MTATNEPGPTGFAIVDKPAGMTSHDVVARARRLLGTKKVGHAGTLDPDATGVLVLGVGRATRLLQFLSGLDKTYTAEVVLGVETSTLDAAGEVTAVHDMAGATLDQVRAAAAGLTGAIEQIPPMVSAVKVGGKRLHELARQGIEVDRPPRRVVVHRFDVDSAREPDVVRIEVDCSSGTYVRTLAADLGRALGGGAHLRNLRRTRIGRFTESEAVPLDEGIELRPALDAVAHLARIDVDDDLAAAVRTGKVLPLPALGAAGEGPWAVVGSGEQLLAVYQPHHAGTAKPIVVLHP